MHGRNFWIRSVGMVIMFMIAAISSANDSTVVRSKRIVLTIGGGVSHFLGEPGVPGHLRTKVLSTGSAFTGRILWHPEHLIRVGIESGLVDLYSYRIEGNGTNGSVALTAIPLLLQWSMRIGPRFQVFAGWGTYRLNSTLDYMGRSRSASFSQGYAAAASYSMPFSDRFEAALEAKWMNAFVTQHHVLALQCRIDVKLVEW